MIFDRNHKLGLALVAEEGYLHPKYVPLDDAAGTLTRCPLSYLQQMHTVANGAVAGLVASQHAGFAADDWEALGPELKFDKALKGRG
jgi:hypothetical protein